MGNIDTKLNFRKAIIQLGTKNQVKEKYSPHTVHTDHTDHNIRSFIFPYSYRFCVVSCRRRLGCRNPFIRKCRCKECESLVNCNNNECTRWRTRTYRVRYSDRHTCDTHLLIYSAISSILHCRITVYVCLFCPFLCRAANSTQQVNANDDAFWEQFWTDHCTNIQDVFALVPANEIRTLRQDNPANLATLCYKATERLVRAVDNSCRTHSEQQTGKQNATHVPQTCHRRAPPKMNK